MKAIRAQSVDALTLFVHPFEGQSTHRADCELPWGAPSIAPQKHQSIKQGADSRGIEF